MLKRIIDSLDKVDESLRKFYKEQDGKFVLDVEDEDVTALKNALQAERNANKEYKKKVPELESKLASLEEDLEKARAKGADQKDKDAIKAEIDRVTAQLTEKYTKEIDTFKSQNESLKTTVNRTILENEAIAALTAAKGKTKVLLPHVQRNLKVVEEDGKFVVRVINDKGEELISKKSGSTEPMSVHEYVESLRNDEEFGLLFEGTNNSGSGSSRTSNGGTSGGGYVPKSIKEVKEKFPGGRVAFIKEHGLSKFESLPAE